MQNSFLTTTFIVDIDGGKIVVANKDASRGSSLALHLQVQVSVREMFFAVPLSFLFRHVFLCPFSPSLYTAERILSSHTIDQSRH